MLFSGSGTEPHQARKYCQVVPPTQSRLAQNFGIWHWPKATLQVNMNDLLFYHRNYNPVDFSLRTMCRALAIAANNQCGQVARSLMEAFSLSFLTQLDKSSQEAVQKQIIQ